LKIWKDNWSDEAKADLRHILRKIRKENKQAAYDLNIDIRASVKVACRFPEGYKEGPQGTRVIVAHVNYKVFFTIEPDHIEVIAVVHSRQMWPPSDEPT
jgi:toxin ParE1/3/4